MTTEKSSLHTDNEIRYSVAILIGNIALTIFAIFFSYFMASAFDYRHALTVLSICTFGFIAGWALYVSRTVITSRLYPLTWLAASGLLAATAVCVASVAPFGGAISFLFAMATVLTPFLTWAIGLGKLQDELKLPGTQIICLTLTGIIAGALLSLWLSNPVISPLALCSLVTAVLSLTILTIAVRRVPLSLIAIGFAALGFAGFYNQWNFSQPPHWIDNADAEIKPFYTTAWRKNDEKRATTTWNGFSRTDITPNRTLSTELLWIFTDGLFSGLIPAESPGAEDTEQLKRNFPLITLALEASEKQNILILNATASLEAKMASDLGVQKIHWAGNNSSIGTVMNQWRDFHGGLMSRPGIMLDVGNTRHSVLSDNNLYDQVLLTIPQKITTLSESGLTDNYLYTKEAFAGTD